MTRTERQMFGNFARTFKVGMEASLQQGPPNHGVGQHDRTVRGCSVARSDTTMFEVLMISSE